MRTVCSWKGWRKTITTPTHPRSTQRRIGLLGSRRMEAASAVPGLTTARKRSCFSPCQSPLIREICSGCWRLQRSRRGPHWLTPDCSLDHWLCLPLAPRAWICKQCTSKYPVRFLAEPFSPTQFGTEGPNCFQGPTGWPVWVWFRGPFACRHLLQAGPLNAKVGPKEVRSGGCGTSH